MILTLTSVGCRKPSDTAKAPATPSAPKATSSPSKSESQSKPKPNSKSAPPPVTSQSSWFTDITKASGLRFTYVEGGTGSRYTAEIMGAGVAMFDFDRDGRLDLYFANGNRALPDATRTDGTPNRLFHQTESGKFVDVTKRSGLGDTGYGMGVAIGDIDNDGFEDVFVTNLGVDGLYRNRGDSTFENITTKSGAGVDGWSASACMFDYDADGFLDIYVARYLVWPASKKCFAPDGRPEYCGPLSFPPVHDVLLHNNGDGTFTDVTEAAGIASVAAAGLGVVCQDLNGDGRQDVYVANDAYANQLWINQGDGTFHDEAFETGAAYNLNGAPEAGMGIVAADFDNDANVDLFMTHLGQESNTLYRNMGGAVGFSDVTSATGLSWSSIPYTGFGVAAMDVELDGDLDICILNGRVRRGNVIAKAAVPPPWDVLAEPNLFYLNNGAGRFEAITEPVSALVSPVEISRGLALGDIDSDGDLDLVVTNIRSPARLYRNDAPRKGHWLIVEAFDPRLKRTAVGARVTLVGDDLRAVRVASATMSYLSSSDSRVHFGIPRKAHLTSIKVDWPDGLSEHFTPPAVNTSIKLIRGSGTRNAKSHDIGKKPLHP